MGLLRDLCISVISLSVHLSCFSHTQLVQNNKQHSVTSVFLSSRARSITCFTLSLTHSWYRTISSTLWPLYFCHFTVCLSLVFLSHTAGPEQQAALCGLCISVLPYSVYHMLCSLSHTAGPEQQAALRVIHPESRGGHCGAVRQWPEHRHVSDWPLLRVAHRLCCHGYHPRRPAQGQAEHIAEHHLSLCLSYHCGTQSSVHSTDIRSGIRLREEHLPRGETILCIVSETYLFKFIYLHKFAVLIYCFN